MSERGDLLRQTVLDQSRPHRPVVARDNVPGRPPWCVVFTNARGLRRVLRHRLHADAVTRAHEVAQLVHDGHTGEFYSRDEILFGMRGSIP